MNPRFELHDGISDIQVLLEDGERLFCRARRKNGDGGWGSTLAVLPSAEHPSPAMLDRFAHEHGLRNELDAAWSARPLELRRAGGRILLLLEDPGGEPLERLVGEPMEAGDFLRLAIGIVAALGKAHQRGLVHKDVKPANILVNGYPLHTRSTAGRGGLPPTIDLYGAGQMATACWANLWKRSPLACERRRLNRKVNSSR